MASLPARTEATRGDLLSKPGFHLRTRSGLSGKYERQHLSPMGGVVHKRLQRSSTRNVGVRAVAYNHTESVLTGVDELPDGSVMLHFAPDGTTRSDEAPKVMSFLTQPLDGHRRDVSMEVLEQLLGNVASSCLNPAQRMAYFMKGVLSPGKDVESVDHHSTTAATPYAKLHHTPSQHAAAASPASTTSTPRTVLQAHPQHVATQPAVIQATTPAAATPVVAAGKGNPTAAASGVPAAAAFPQANKVDTHVVTESLTPPPKSVLGNKAEVQAATATPAAATASGSGQAVDAVRVTAVLSAAAMAAMVFRFLAMISGLTANIPATSPAPLIASVLAFLLSTVVLWLTGFARVPEAKTAEAAA